MADYDISEAFQAIEEEIMSSMCRNLQKHLNWENEEGFDWTMWQAEQLKGLQDFRLQNKKLFEEYTPNIDSQIDDFLKQAYKNGALSQEVKILEAIKKGYKPRSSFNGSTNISGGFFKVNDRKLNSLIKATSKDMSKVQTAILRMSDDEYRKAIFNSQVYFNTGAGTLKKAVDMATKDFLSKGINCIEYKNGAKVQASDYSKMALRTANRRAYIQGEAKMRDDWGENTVIVTRRGVACPKCINYCGKVFYDDVYGSLPVKDSKYPRLSTAIAGGLYHPNCKDTHTTYFEGINTPPRLPNQAEKEKAEKVYNLEQQQRYNERNIRKYKRLEANSIDPDNKAQYSNARKNFQAKQKELIENNSDVLRRHYENESIQGTSLLKANKMFTNGKNSDIINKELRCYGDYLRDKLGSAYINNIDEVEEIIKDIESKGGQFLVNDTGKMVYNAPGNGKAGTIDVDRNISIGGLRHEYRHFLDDEATNFSGINQLLRDKDALFQREYNGYLEELNIARQYHYDDVEKKILDEIEMRRKEIYGKK